MKDAPIRTVDDLAFEFGREALLRRWIAAMLDTVLVGALIASIISLVPPLQQRGSGLPIVAGLIIWFCYFFFMEMQWGVSPGKLITDLRVVDAEGNVPDKGKAAVRTLMRLVEINPVIFGAGPAAISIFLSKVSQRIADRMVGTYVLRRTDLARIEPYGKLGAIR